MFDGFGGDDEELLGGGCFLTGLCLQFWNRRVRFFIVDMDGSGRSLGSLNKRVNFCLCVTKIVRVVWGD